MADAGHGEVGLELSTEAGEGGARQSRHRRDGGAASLYASDLPKNAKTNPQSYFCDEYHKRPVQIFQEFESSNGLQGRFKSEACSCTWAKLSRINLTRELLA